MTSSFSQNKYLNRELKTWKKRYTPFSCISIENGVNKLDWSDWLIVDELNIEYMKVFNEYK